MPPITRRDFTKATVVAAASTVVTAASASRVLGESVSSGSEIVAIRSWVVSSNRKIVKRLQSAIYISLIANSRQQKSEANRNNSVTIANCSTGRTLTPWSSPRRTIGTPCR